MSNTALPVEWTAGAELIQRPPRQAIIDLALFENAFSKHLAVKLSLFNGLLVDFGDSKLYYACTHPRGSHAGDRAAGLFVRCDEEASAFSKLDPGYRSRCGRYTVRPRHMTLQGDA